MLNAIKDSLMSNGVTICKKVLSDITSVSIIRDGCDITLNYAIYNILKNNPKNLSKIINSGYLPCNKMKAIAEIKRTGRLSKTQKIEFINHFRFQTEVDIVMYLGEYTFVRFNQWFDGDYPSGHTRKKITITFYGKNAYRQMNLLLHFEEMADKKFSGIFALSAGEVLMLNNHGDTYRSKDSVIVPEDTLEQIYTYLQNCFEISDNIFKKTHVTISPGILFYGPPGTGKTSIVEVIAREFGCDIFYLDVTDIHECQRLVSDEIYRSGLTRKKIFVFEDIDVVAEKRDNKAVTSDDKIGINRNFNTLLQILDGYLSKPDVIKIATTNHIDKIDPAIIRFGRFDLKIKMDNFDRPMAERMCKNFNVSKEILDTISFPINPAELQCVILDNYQKYRLDKK